MIEIEGNLIELALKGQFDVIAHGCNCFCKQKSGIAKNMVEIFRTDSFYKEGPRWIGNIEKLGNIVGQEYYLNNGKIEKFNLFTKQTKLEVYNMYTQYYYKTHPDNKDEVCLDYEALTLCLRKLNAKCKGKKIGLPKIGAGLAGGDWNKIKKIIQETLLDCDVTIVSLV